MSCYIKRDDVNKILFDADISMSEYDRTRKEVEKLPSIDIIRCKDCRYWEYGTTDDFGIKYGLCSWLEWRGTQGGDYCSRGEREERKS